VAAVEVASAGLRGILDGLLKVDGVTAALVIGRDGFVIESAAAHPIDADAVAAIAASSLAAAEAMGEEMKLGALGSILIEYEIGPVAVTLAGPDAVLAVVGNQGTNLGRVRIEMRKIRQAVANQL
jgi:predicted regulator of Ras-like GTPase activity (Roadblock/LC7/MglB family)